MGVPAIEVFQNLQVFSVEVEGIVVRVDVYGGAESVCGTVVYKLPDAGSARQKAAILRRWQRLRTPVTYVRRDGTASLLDEAAMLDEALRE